mmetsp:Transcript_38102/g.104889  ORF Transcript_38102/g.104889 Transcript_38102/m.104889 type:complete len:255 (+) Transcript_38102:35-799(+)
MPTEMASGERSVNACPRWLSPVHCALCVQSGVQLAEPVGEHGNLRFVPSGLDFRLFTCSTEHVVLWRIVKLASDDVVPSHARIQHLCFLLKPSTYFVAFFFYLLNPPRVPLPVPRRGGRRHPKRLAWRVGVCVRLGNGEHLHWRMTPKVFGIGIGVGRACKGIHTKLVRLELVRPKLAPSQRLRWWMPPRVFGIGISVGRRCECIRTKLVRIELVQLKLVAVQSWSWKLVGTVGTLELLLLLLQQSSALLMQLL